MGKVIIIVIGKDTVGIIAKICTYLADTRCNVLDISQTITAGIFNMMMVVDVSGYDRQFADLQADLRALGDEIGVEIHVQREEIFEKMHRI